MILYSEAITLSDNYVSFGELGGAVLRMLARTRGVKINDADLQELKEGVATMPPHPEVRVPSSDYERGDFVCTLDAQQHPKQLAHGNSRKPNQQFV